VKRLRDEFGDKLVVITDVCLCGSTSHGHCGVLRDGKVINDESLPLLNAMALAHARAGADVVAPSDMMDGRVAAMRTALDDAGLSDTAILSYSTKFASGFYGPFREAADSAPKSGDRKSYQLDPRNAREALRESLLDEAEGADMLMVKPALAYLDVISAVRRETHVPLAAYNVSGEYSMVKAAAARGWIDEARVTLEILHGIARAGADLLITYHAREALAQGWIQR
jgi:porphobilinogen synthase